MKGQKHHQVTAGMNEQIRANNEIINKDELRSN
jgi:hypothetical protein